MNAYRSLGNAELVQDPATGEVFARRNTLRSPSSGFGFGADDFGADEFGADFDGYDSDGDFAGDLSGGEAAYFGALSKAERKAYRARKKAMRQGNRAERKDLRSDKRADRRDDNDRPGNDRGDGGYVHKSGWNTPLMFSGSFTVSAAGAWSFQFLPQAEALLTELWLTAPTGTLVTSITIGMVPILTGGAVDQSVFASSSYIRGLVAGRKVTPSLPITFAGTTTATSGTISGGVFGHGPAPC